MTCTLVQGVPARADELSDFEAARRAYDDQQYSAAARRFERLVNDESLRLRSRPLVLESWKYLGASYLFLGRQRAAEEQFEHLLREERTYDLDPVAFPSEVQQLFASVRARLQHEEEQRAEGERRLEEQRQRERTEREKRERETMMRLRALASEESVEEVHSRWIAMVPFGAGQYQNGNDGLGLALAVTEGALAAISIATYIAHETIRPQVDVQLRGADETDERRSARQAAEILSLTNKISFVLFASVAIVGVLEAQLRFEPVVRTTRRRDLPPDVRSRFELGVGLGGASATLRF